MRNAMLDVDLIKHYLDNYTVNTILYNGNNIKSFAVDGVIMWGSKEPAVLDVAKITSNTYAGETTYSNESFLLLDIYPKAMGSSVKVTYGDLTKELTFTGTNAQQVFFGTFNGVSDDIATPSSGRLTIEGEFIGFGVGAYEESSKSFTDHYCSCITSIVNMSDITTIPDNAFSGCKSLTNIKIPNSVTSVGSWAFNNCTSITDVFYKGGLKRWLNISFNTSSSNPMYYGANLYFNNKLVTEIVIPDATTSIGTNIFGGCKSLTSITIPDSVTSIGDYTLFGTSLTGIDIPDSVTSIGDYALANCKILTNVKIPNSVTSIGTGVFTQDTSLTSIEIPDSVTSIGGLAFALCESLTDVVIGNSVTNIGYMAFSNCSSLTNVVMPNSVTSIGERAFEYCNKLEISEFHEGLTYIGDAAFLAKEVEPYDMLTLPASLQELGQNSFAYANGDNRYSRVKNIKMCGSTPPVMSYSIDSSNDELSIGAFGSKSTAASGIISITVPKGSGEAYKTADGWSLYASKIVEES